jgi:hypothetical protein
MLNASCESRDRASRYRAAVIGFAAMIASFDGARADDQSSFIVDMTHAFYAKVYCSGVDVVYDNFVKAARAQNLDVGIVEEVRKGIAFLNTNGKMGEKPRKDVFDAIILAAKMVALDHKTTGVESWCKFRSESLLKSGFIKSAEATPTIDETNKRLDEQFSEMRKGMPMQVSAVSKLTNVYRTGMTLNYTYEDKLSTDKWSETDKKKLLADVTKNQCDGKNTRMLIEFGYAFAAIHVDESGKFIAHLYVDKSKCE